jgi:eukaryotic-like serine/threonine-protein kinase
MGFISRIRTIFRLFLLFAVLLAVALLSAITTIRLTIHSGEEKTPNLVGLPLEEAQRSAGALGLGVKIEDRLFNPKYAENHIVSQVPAPGDSTKAGQEVHVIASLGVPSVTVPDLVGDSVRAAQVTAVQRGLALGDVAAMHWPGTAVDQVIAQDPPPSSRAVHSPDVNLLVSLGESPAEFVCPSFVGMPIGTARTRLAGAGLIVGAVQEASPAPATASGTIVSQSPPAGSKIAAGASFTFTVAP